jgi:hypothetical protein
MTTHLSIYFIAFIMFFYSCSEKTIPSTSATIATETADSSFYPPYTWQEHWFDHRQLIKRVHFNNNVAIYFDDDVSREKTSWLFGLVDSAWAYTKKEYGSFGNSDRTNRLFAIFHTNKYGGGHPGTYLASRHDFRNVIDLGAGANAWTNQTDWELSATIHEISHIVEGASKGVKESPAFDIWGDSKWAEIYVYDIYNYLGRTDIQKRVFDECMEKTDAYPRANTAWFRNWFFPIYEQYGKVKVLNRFFELLAAHFPKRSGANGISTYASRMTMGEFVHFWSGASGVDLSIRAQMAFGNKDRSGADWWPQFEKAKKDFSGITYKADSTYGTIISKQALLEVSNENENGPNSTEGSSKLTDLDNNTKFLVQGFKPTFFALQIPADPVVSNAYILTSGNDAPARDPKAWILEGSQDKLSWTVLDRKTNQLFTYRNEIKIFDFINTVAYKYYRLRIIETAGDADMQLSEWILLKK